MQRPLPLNPGHVSDTLQCTVNERHHEIQLRKDRWLRTFKNKDQPGLLFLIRQPARSAPRPAPISDNIPQRIEWAWQKYQMMIEDLDWLEDDTLPYLDCYTGTEIFAEAFGSRAYLADNNMPYAHPVIFSSSEARALQAPQLSHPSLTRVFSIADELTRRAGPGALVRMVDVQSPMDIAAILWEKADFFTAMLDDPDSVHELSSKIRQLLTAFLDKWFADYGKDHIAHYPDYYMEGGMTLSEDEIGSISPQMFDDLFLPELNLLSGRFGGIGVHCCANSRHQWGGLQKIKGLRLLNLVQPQNIITEALEVFGSKVVHWHSWGHHEDVVGWLESLPSKTRLIIEVEAQDKEDAKRKADLLNRWRSARLAGQDV